jgi:hypothetical protein
VREYDLFVPLNYNDGTPIDPDKIPEISRRLLDEFGGLTFFSQPNEGLWRMGDVTYRDDVVIFRVLARNRRSARRFLSALKAELLESLKQEEILIVERSIDTI